MKLKYLAIALLIATGTIVTITACGKSGGSKVLRDEQGEISHYTCPMHPQIHEDMVVSLFTERPFLVTIDEAKTKLSKDFISYPLTNNLALGLSKVRDTHWLWFDHHAIAEILENGHIIVYMKEYIQEIKDYLKRTKSDGRFTI